MQYTQLWIEQSRLTHFGGGALCLQNKFMACYTFSKRYTTCCTTNRGYNWSNKLIVQLTWHYHGLIRPTSVKRHVYSENSSRQFSKMAASLFSSSPWCHEICPQALYRGPPELHIYQMIIFSRKGRDCWMLIFQDFMLASCKIQHKFRSKFAGL